MTSTRDCHTLEIDGCPPRRVFAVVVAGDDDVPLDWFQEVIRRTFGHHSRLGVCGNPYSLIDCCGVESDCSGYKAKCVAAGLNLRVEEVVDKISRYNDARYND